MTIITELVEREEMRNLLKEPKIRVTCRNCLITIILEAEVTIKRVLGRINRVRRNLKNRKWKLKKSSKQSTCHLRNTFRVEKPIRVSKFDVKPEDLVTVP
jgi:hypothetical protein